jgi:hypothetical protein
VGNLTNINYPTSPDISFAYDPLNRLTNLIDAVGTTRYAYAHHALLSVGALATVTRGTAGGLHAADDYHATGPRNKGRPFSARLKFIGLAAFRL